MKNFNNLKVFLKEYLIVYSSPILGDFVIFLDLCKKYKEASGYDSYIILKKTNKTLADIAEGYPFVKVIALDSFFDSIKLIKVVIFSIFIKNTYFIKSYNLTQKPKLKAVLFIVNNFTKSLIYTRFLAINKLEINSNFTEVNNNFVSYMIGRSIVFESSLNYSKELNDNFLNDYGTKKNDYMCLVLGASNIRRMISPNDWNKIISLLIKKHPNKKLILLGAGSSTEVKCLKEINDLIKFDYINLMGSISIQRAINILSLSYLIIGPNTGLTLLAYMLKNVKTIIFSEKLEGNLFYNLKSKNCKFIENSNLCPCDKESKNNSYCCLSDINIFDEFKKSFHELFPAIVITK